MSFSTFNSGLKSPQGNHLLGRGESPDILIVVGGALGSSAYPIGHGLSNSVLRINTNLFLAGIAMKLQEKSSYNFNEKLFHLPMALQEKHATCGHL